MRVNDPNIYKENQSSTSTSFTNEVEATAIIQLLVFLLPKVVSAEKQAP
jgi:hypothetical protein